MIELISSGYFWAGFAVGFVSIICGSMLIANRMHRDHDGRRVGPNSIARVHETVIPVLRKD